jgi:hypothetical protein
MFFRLIKNTGPAGISPAGQPERATVSRIIIDLMAADALTLHRVKN